MDKSDKAHEHGKPASLADNDDGKVLGLGLAANMLFFFGTAIFVSFSVLELNDRDRTTAGTVTYIVAFCCFLLSGIIELVIDVYLERRIRHARYTEKSCWNKVTSTLFILGVLLDIVAFALWDSQWFVEEHRVLYASTSTLLLTALLVLWEIGRPSNLFSNCQDGLDGVGNVLFFIGALVSCIALYLSEPEPFENTTVGRLEFSTSVIWLVTGICFVWADVLRMKESNDSEHDLNQKQEDEEVEIKVDPTQQEEDEVEIKVDPYAS